MRKGKEIKPTIKGRLIIDDDIARAKLLHLMRMFRDAVEMAHYYLRHGIDFCEAKRRLTRFLSNSWYANSAIKRARLYQKQPYLRLKKPQLFSVGCKHKSVKGNRNIRLASTSKVLIKIPHADGKHEWIEARMKIGSKHLPIVEELITTGYGYGATITLKEKRGKRRFYIHLHIPLRLYVKYMKKESKAKITSYIAGFDFNPDRVCMVIIDQRGTIRDIKNEYFSEITSHGLPKERSKTIRREAIAKLVKYAREHGVKYFVIENLRKPKPKGSKKAKRKQSKMALREFIRQMEILVHKVDGTLIKVNPAYSSVSARIIAKDLGLDIHSASAYIIALRGLRRRNKSI